MDMDMYEQMLDRLKHLKSWGVVVVSENTKIQELATDKGSRILLRVIEGKEAQDQGAFMKALLAPLEMPSYFGENWSALDDSLHDMEWLQADAYLIAVADADKVLNESEEDFRILLDILRDAYEDWQDPKSDSFITSWTKDPKDMFLLLQVSPENQGELAKRLKLAGVTLPFVRLDSLLGS